MLAEALAAICSDPDVLARLGGPLGEAARGVRHDHKSRAHARAAVHVPDVAGVHRSWIEHALVMLPARVRHDLVENDGSPVALWLARWATASLAPLPAADVTRPRSIAEAVRMTDAALVEWLQDVGADQIAFAMGNAAAMLVRVFGGKIEHAIARVEQAPRKGNLGTRRAAVERAKLAATDTGDELVRIGARAIAPYTDALIRRQLAVRLPRTLGSAVLFELAEHHRDPVDASPTWTALACTTGPGRLPLTR